MPVQTSPTASTSSRCRFLIPLAVSLALHGLTLALPVRFSRLGHDAGKWNLTHGRSLLVQLPQQATYLTNTAGDVPLRTEGPREAFGTLSEEKTKQDSVSPNSQAPILTVPATSTGLVSGPWYYSAQYLHRHPIPLHPIRPDYPLSAEHVSGRVLLLLLINEKGQVDRYQIVASEPSGIFDDTVIDAFRQASYAPGLISGIPVKSQLVVEVNFQPGQLPQTSVTVELPHPL